MQTEKRLLGIDLGGCMSGNSAYLYAKVDSNGMEIIEAFKEPKHRDHESCLKFLVDACGKHRVDAIAIDAPLSIPKPLHDPFSQILPREGSGEIINPYLYRYTDYYLYKTFGLRPMPPAGDRIGRLTARAVALLHKLDYRFPNITLNGRQIPIYEVYPKQIAAYLEFGDYKKSPDTLFRHLNTSLKSYDEHMLDALLCVYGGYRVLNGYTTKPPAEAGDEGWCFPVL